jgi:hypothetical protein
MVFEAAKTQKWGFCAPKQAVLGIKPAVAFDLLPGAAIKRVANLELFSDDPELQSDGVSRRTQQG